MEKIFIDYGKRINTAILGVIKDILKDLSNSKISSNHCFYISFKTKDSGVNISNNLLKQYPNEMNKIPMRSDLSNFSDVGISMENPDNLSVNSSVFQPGTSYYNENTLKSW